VTEDNDVSEENNRWTEGPEVTAEDAPGGAAWSQRQIETLLHAGVVERRRARRWGILFKSLTFAYLVAVLVMISPGVWDEKDSTGPHTALVDIDGVIAAGMDVDADRVAGGLRNALENPDSVAVILRINSPGGSPVQSGYIYDEIRRLRLLHPKKKIYAVIADIGASGGYYIAAAADTIYADRASFVGSIGVRMDSFGFDKAIERLGIERRLHTAGEHKGLLDPFLPEDEDEVAHIQGLLDQVHGQFIDAVKRGRGDRLADDPDLFSGLVWTGEQALELGLIDGLGSSGYVAREVIGTDRIVNYTPKREIWERVVDRIGASAAATIINRMSVTPR